MKKSELKSIIKECIQETDQDNIRISKKIEKDVNGQKGISIKVKIVDVGSGNPMSIHVGSEVDALVVSYYYRNSKRNSIEKAGGMSNRWLVVVGN